MIETLIAASSAVTTIVTVSCTDINTLVDRAKVYPDLSVEERQEIIDLYYDFGEDQVCIVGTQKPTEGTEHGSLARVKGVNFQLLQEKPNGNSHLSWCRL